MIHPTIFKESSNTLIIEGDDLKRLKKKPKQILWVKDGIYGMVPIEVVKNALEFQKIFACAQGGDITKHQLTFQWDETVEIPQSTGRSMEDCNGDNIQRSN